MGADSGGRRFRFHSRGAGAAHGLRGRRRRRRFALASAAYRDSPVDGDPQGRQRVAPVDGRRPAQDHAVRAQSRRGLLPGRARPACWAAAASRSSSPSAPSRRSSSSTAWRPTASAGSATTGSPAVMVLCGLLFLPGLLLWLLVFQLRTHDRQARGQAGLRARHRAAGRRRRPGRDLPDQLPFTGFWAWYARAVRGRSRSSAGCWAKRICERTAKDLRDRWDGLLSGGGVGAKIPEAVPGSPGETARRAAAPGPGQAHRRAAVQLGLLRRPKGILGMGTRWGSWQLAEDLVPARRGQGDPPVPQLGRHPRRSTTSCACWSAARSTPAVPEAVGQALDRHARRRERQGRSSRPERHGRRRLPDQDARDTGHLQQAAVRQRRPALPGVQLTLWDGQLVITMLITVTVLHETLRIEVTGHALGPVHSLFTTQARGQGEGGRRSRSGSGRPGRSSSRWSTPTRSYGSPRARRSPGTRRCSNWLGG